MARYTGPKVKISRREGTDIFDTPKWNKRNFPPGQHGPSKASKRTTDYGKQLREKQKAKLMYGLLERQFRNLFEKAQGLEGDLGTNLLLLLEKRLDNVLYRSGLAKTRRLARQLISHGHITVDGRKTDIPSYSVKSGQKIAVKASKLKNNYWKQVQEEIKKVRPASWISLDVKGLGLQVTSEPMKEELPANIETKQIIEFYSR